MNQQADAIQTEGGNLKWMGILTIILGILAMFAPLMTGFSIVLLVGLMVVAGGIARMIWAFKSASFGQGLFKFVIGLLTLICGIIMVSDPVSASGALTLIIAFYLFFDGGFEIAAALTGAVPSGRGWLIFAGIISILLGLMIWRQFPLSGAWALGIFLGIKLLFAGMTMLSVGKIVQKNG